MLSEASYPWMAIQTAVRNRDWSTRSFTSGVAQFEATALGLFPTLSKGGPIALFRWFARPVSTLQLVDGLAGGLAHCGHE